MTLRMLKDAQTGQDMTIGDIDNATRWVKTSYICDPSKPRPDPNPDAVLPPTGHLAAGIGLADEMFAKYDKDQDGLLSLEELAEKQKAELPAQIESMGGTCDSNKCGVTKCQFLIS